MKNKFKVGDLVIVRSPGRFGSTFRFSGVIINIMNFFNHRILTSQENESIYTVKIDYFGAPRDFPTLETIETTEKFLDLVEDEVEVGDEILVKATVVDKDSHFIKLADMSGNILPGLYRESDIKKS